MLEATVAATRGLCSDLLQRAASQKPGLLGMFGTMDSPLNLFSSYTQPGESSLRYKKNHLTILIKSILDQHISNNSL